MSRSGDSTVNVPPTATQTVRRPPARALGGMAVLLPLLLCSVAEANGFVRFNKNSRASAAGADTSHLVSSVGWPVSEGSISFEFTPSSTTPTGFAISCSDDNGATGWQVEITTSGIRFHGSEEGTVTHSSISWTASQAYDIALVWENPTEDPDFWDLTFYLDGIEIDGGTIVEITSIPAQCSKGMKIDRSSPVTGVVAEVCADASTTGCLSASPTTSSVAASSIAVTTATLNGSAKPNGNTTTGWFRYATSSPGACDDSFGTRAPGSGGDALSDGSSAVAFNEAVTGLAANTTYYFCAIAENSSGKTFGSVLNFTTLPPEIEFFAAGSDDGLPNLAGTLDFCSHFASDITGAQSWCIEADGDTGGTLAVSEVGTPTEVTTQRECPNGVTCSTATRQRSLAHTSVEQGWKTADQPVVATDFSIFMLVRTPNQNDLSRILNKSTSSAVRQIRVDASTSSLQVVLTKTDDTNLTANTSGNYLGALLFIVITVDQGTADSDSGQMKVYINNMTTASASGGISGASMKTGTHPWRLGHESDQDGAGLDVFVAGVTHTFLDATKRQAMYDYAIGRPSDVSGAIPITTSRSTVIGCFPSDLSTSTTIGQDRACVSDDGAGNPRIRTHFASFNQAKVSEQMDDATWSKLGGTFAAPTVTRNIVASTDGLVTADRVVFPAISTGAGKYSYLRLASNTAIAGGNPFSAGVWLRISAGTGKVYLWQKYSTEAQTLTSTACNLTTDWSFCTSLNDTSHAGTNAHHLFVGFDNDALGQGGDTLATQTIYIDKAQWHALSALAPYCATTTSTVQCAGNRHSFVKPSASLSNTTGCMGATFHPTFNNSEGYLLRFGAAGYMSVDNNELFCNDGTNTATLAISDPLNTTIRAVCTWTGTTLTIKKIGGSSATATYDGDMFAAGDVTTYVGHNNNANYANGWLSRIAFDNSTTGCD